MYETTALVSISIIFIIAAILTIIARLIRQPPIIAYLFAGVMVGPLILGLVGPNSESSAFLQIFARMGVAFLLFIVGLSLDFKLLKEFGKVAALAGIGEVILTSSIGFLLALAIGFKSVPAVYLAAALAFSSTVVVVKILSDKKEIDTLHGRLALGILIVEDFAAAAVLMIVPVMQSHDLTFIFLALMRIIAIIGSISFVSIFFIGKVIQYLARNQETLFLFGIAWALMIATLFNFFDLSLEIGALIAGMALASSKYTLELGGKIKPLRDFFVVLLFVFFGSQLVGPIKGEIIRDAIVFSIFILIGKPIIVMSFVRIFGYKKRTTFLTGSSLAQISEFSLILILIGFNLGHLDQDFMNLAILVSLITIAVSSYSIYHSSAIFNKISRFLDILERKKSKRERENVEEKFEVIIFGYHRIGYKILDKLKKMKLKYLVVDYNPKVIIGLEEAGIPCIFGDASDRDFLSEIPIKKTKIVISTISEEDANINIREKLSSLNKDAIFIATAEQPREAYELYENGVDYVIVPHHIGGEFMAEILEHYKSHKSKYKELGKKHFSELKKAKNKSKFI